MHGDVCRMLPRPHIHQGHAIAAGILQPDSTSNPNALALLNMLAGRLAKCCVQLQYGDLLLLDVQRLFFLRDFFFSS